MDQKKIKWLEQESGQWVEDGIITPLQRSQIQMRYPASSAGSPLLLFFAIIGSVLVGTGIILVFATNWWKLTMEVRIFLAFLPLAAAEGIGVYIWRKQYHSLACREGGAIFLSLSFFATLALIGQIFHTSSDLSSYVLVCILLTLPGAYLFRSKAAMSIFVLGCVMAAWDWDALVVLGLMGLSLPYFYIQLCQKGEEAAPNYLLFLVSILTANTVIQVLIRDMTVFETALICGLALILVDALFRFISPSYGLNAAKLFSAFVITATILAASLDFQGSETVSPAGFIWSGSIGVIYLVLRRRMGGKVTSSDLFFISGILLLIGAPFGGAVACLLAVGLGIYYIVLGSKVLELGKLNYGMTLVIAVILIRFFDSSLGLLARGVVFILLGIMFLAINLGISRKRKEQRS